MSTLERENLEGQALGKYQVIRKIGEGNMATVYLGQDPFIDRAVAIKVAHNDIVQSKTDGAMYKRFFFNEAQAAGMLKHPNITSIFDAGVDQDRYYIVMEYVHGGQTLDAYTDTKTLLPLDRVTGVLYKCALALDYAHKKGVIHRDIKPRNILLTEDYEPKISDFGVALVPHLQAGQELENVGSPLYMCPEQIRQETATKQCDLFALGVVGYELLTGKHPFYAGNIEAIHHRVLHTNPQPLANYRADIPDIYQRIINKALAKNLPHRYKNGADMAGDISLVYDFLRLSSKQPTQQDKFARAQDVDFFRDFQDDEIWEIIHAGDWVTAVKGEEIIHEGDTDHAFYVLIEGEVTVEKGQREIVRLLPGDCFGEMALVTQRRRTATIRACGDVAALRLRSSVIERATVNAQLRFQRQFLYALIRRLEYATTTIASD